MVYGLWFDQAAQVSSFFFSKCMFCKWVELSRYQCSASSPGLKREFWVLFVCEMRVGTNHEDPTPTLSPTRNSQIQSSKVGAGQILVLYKSRSEKTTQSAEGRKTTKIVELPGGCRYLMVTYGNMAMLNPGFCIPDGGNSRGCSWNGGLLHSHWVAAEFCPRSWDYRSVGSHISSWFSLGGYCAPRDSHLHPLSPLSSFLLRCVLHQISRHGCREIGAVIFRAWIIGCNWHRLRRHHLGCTVKTTV